MNGKGKGKGEGKRERDGMCYLVGGRGLKGTFSNSYFVSIFLSQILDEKTPSILFLIKSNLFSFFDSHDEYRVK